MEAQHHCYLFAKDLAWVLRAVMMLLYTGKQEPDTLVTRVATPV
jgi:hypothetical protein